jgi:hypothetical protein
MGRIGLPSVARSGHLIRDSIKTQYVILPYLGMSGKTAMGIGNPTTREKKTV